MGVRGEGPRRQGAARQAKTNLRCGVLKREHSRPCVGVRMNRRANVLSISGRWSVAAGAWPLTSDVSRLASRFYASWPLASGP